MSKQGRGNVATVPSTTKAEVFKHELKNEAESKSQNSQDIPSARARYSEDAACPAARSATRALARADASANWTPRASARLSASAARPRDWSRSPMTWPSSDRCRCASTRAAAASAPRSTQSNRRSAASALRWERRSVASASAALRIHSEPQTSASQRMNDDLAVLRSVRS